MKKRIPYGRQTIGGSDIAAVVKVLRSDWLTQGPAVSDFERSLAEYTGARFAVCCSNGTAALHLACLAAGVTARDRVITAAVTFVASANCGVYCGASPVLCDVHPDTALIVTDQIRRRLAGNTKAVIPVHYAGQSADMRAIRSIVAGTRTLVIEDAAHALGAVYEGAPVGSCRYSDMTIFSFHPVKAITTGEGGAVTTNNRGLYDKLLSLRNHGIVRDGRTRQHGEWFYEMRTMGFNYRMTDIQAALGISQLRQLDGFIRRRRMLARVYDRAFHNSPWVDIPRETGSNRCAYHLYPVRLKDSCAARRRAIFDALRSEGIGVQVHYIPVYLHPFYRKYGFRRSDFPGAEDFYAREISLPLYPGLTASQQQRVIRTFIRVAESIAKGKKK